MPVEASQNPEQPKANGSQEKKDPVIERAEQDLKRTAKEERESKADIQAHIVTLNTRRDELDAAHEEAKFDKNADRVLALEEALAKVDAEIKAEEEALKAADAAGKSDREAIKDRLAEKAETGSERAKTRAELEADSKKQEAIMLSEDPKVTLEQKQAAKEARDADKKAIAQMDRAEKRDHAMEEAKRYQDEAARIQTAEAQRADVDLAASLKAGEVVHTEPAEGEKIASSTPEVGKDDQGKEGDKKVPPVAPPSSVETGGGIRDRLDISTLGLAHEIAGVHPTDTMGKISLGMKSFLFKLTMAFGSGDGSWLQASPESGLKPLSETEQQVLRKTIGLDITATGKKNDAGKDTYTIKWVEPDKEFIEPDRITQDVFYTYCGSSEWINTYDRVSKLNNNKAKVSDVLASLPTPPTTGADIGLQKMIDALKTEGVKDDDLFLDAVSKKGSFLKGEKEETQGEAKDADKVSEKDDSLSLSADLSDPRFGKYLQADFINGQKFNSATPYADFFVVVSKELGLLLSADFLKADPDASQFDANFDATLKDSPRSILALALPHLEASKVDEYKKAFEATPLALTESQISELKTAVKTTYSEARSVLEGETLSGKLQAASDAADADSQEKKTFDAALAALKANDKPA